MLIAAKGMVLLLIADYRSRKDGRGSTCADTNAKRQMGTEMPNTGWRGGGLVAGCTCRVRWCYVVCVR
jgi:hypothetical protein